MPDLTGRKILEFDLFSKNYKSNSNTHAFTTINQILYKENKDFYKKNEENFSSWLSFKTPFERGNEKIARNVYITTNNNSSVKKNIIESLGNGLNLKPNELIFYIE